MLRNFVVQWLPRKGRRSRRQVRLPFLPYSIYTNLTLTLRLTPGSKLGQLLRAVYYL